VSRAESLLNYVLYFPLPFFFWKRSAGKGRKKNSAPPPSPLGAVAFGVGSLPMATVDAGRPAPSSYLFSSSTPLPTQPNANGDGKASPADGTRLLVDYDSARKPAVAHLKANGSPAVAITGDVSLPSSVRTSSEPVSRADVFSSRADTIFVSRADARVRPVLDNAALKVRGSSPPPPLSFFLFHPEGGALCNNYTSHR